MMRKNRGTLSVLAAAMLLVLAGCANAGEPYTQRSYTAPIEEVQTVSVDVRDRTVTVVLSPDDQIHISCYESTKEYYTFAAEGRELTLKATADKQWTDYIGGKTPEAYRGIELAVPQSTLEVLRISTTNGRIVLPELEILDSVQLSSNGGDIELSGMSAGNSISLDAKNADITGTITGSYDDYAITSNAHKGESSLPSRKEGGPRTLTVSTNNGDIVLALVM